MYPQLKTKKIEFLIIFAYFTLFILFLILSKHTFLGVQDEALLHATLMNNEPINYMTSYPLAKIFGYLYVHFPLIQWYSVMMIGYIVFMAMLMSSYIVYTDRKSTVETFIFKGLLLLLFTLLIIYMLLEVDVTSTTLIMVVLAIPLIRKEPVYFWFLLWIASFLREQIIMSTLPLIVLAYIVQFSKEHWNRRNILPIVLLILGILFNHFSYKLDKTYDDWMDFTEKRAYYTDFGGIETKNILTPDEYHLSKTWWITDLDLYPYKKITKAAGSTTDIIRERFSKEKPRVLIKSIFNRHPSLLLLLLCSFIVILIYKSSIRFLAYGTFFIGFLFLMVVKDVERVTLPMMLVWWSMLISDFLYYEKKKYNRLIKVLVWFILLWTIVYIAETLPLNRIIDYEKREAKVKEFKKLLVKNNMELEITSGYPASWEKLIDVIMQNHLFDEVNWVDYHDDLLISGWLTRVPLVYKQHNISFNGTKRKYEHYHDWLLEKNTGIIGSKGETKHIRPFLSNRLMKLYDEKFPKEGCHHSPIVVDQSENFIIHQIIQKCTDIIEIKQNILLEDKEKIWEMYKHINSHTNGLILHSNVLEAFNNDPWILVGSDKIYEKNLLFHIELESPADTVLQIFYRTKEGENFSQRNSLIVTIHKGKNSLLFKFPSKYLKYTLRLDPVAKKGKYKIGDISIYKFN